MQKASTLNNSTYILLSGMVPLWIYTVGAEILGAPVTIPILGMFMMLIFLLIVPTAAGILVRRKKPCIADKIVKYLRPITYIVLLLLFVVGIYVNLYVLQFIGTSSMAIGGVLRCIACCCHDALCLGNMSGETAMETNQDNLYRGGGPEHSSSNSYTESLN